MKVQVKHHNSNRKTAHTEREGRKEEERESEPERDSGGREREREGGGEQGVERERERAQPLNRLDPNQPSKEQAKPLTGMKHYQ